MAKRNLNKLSLIWDKRENDFVVKYPRRCDGALIMNKILGNILQWSLKKSSKHESPAFDVFNLKDELEKEDMIYPH
ncbi:hypothetical protein COB55_03375 [Candidatus Wolfebacteria bacterium]|nr:MAG: hypothetical protein COB55_03375 [Candidatus Wolfebacteria bacterium]